MAWTLYRVTWRLEGPLHSGFAKLGNIQRTRLYVTGRMLWGALTARVTRDQGRDDYRTVGDQVSECLRFSYGYLCLTEDGGPSLLPEYTAKGLQYKLGNHRLTEREAQRLCLTSYASTALDYANNAAVDGSLHEVEFISPRTLCEQKKLSVEAAQPLYLTALIAEKENASSNPVVKDWLEACCRLEIGGERTYGFGKLTRQNCVQVKETDYPTAWFGSEFVGNNSKPAVIMRNGNVVAAHVALGHKVSFGQVEPFAGRATRSAANAGQCIEYSGVYWLPGSIFDEEVVCLIGEHGLWNH